MDLLEALQAAHALARGRVAEIKPDDWNLPTPCTEWNVGRMSLHLVQVMEAYDALLADSLTSEAGKNILSMELTSDMARPTLDEVSERLCTRFAGPGVLAKAVAHPVGVLDGSDLARFSVFECCVHSWDLAQAIGVDGSFGEELAQIGYDGAVPFIDRIRELSFIKPPTTDQLPEDSAQARLLQLFGRVP